MYEEILGNIRTKDEAEKLLDEIDLLMESLYKDHEGTFEETLNKKVRNWVKLEIEKLLDSKKDKKEILSKLKEEIDGLNYLKMNMAFEPTSAGIDRFFGFVKKNIGPNNALDISYDPSLLGGVQISYKGEYGDFSLRKRFDENYSRIEEKIDEILNDKRRKQIE